MKRKLNNADVPEPQIAHESEPAAASAPATFADLALDARLLQSLQRAQLTTPTPVQAQTVPLLLQGRNVLARAKTGSGKTLAYLLPIVHSILIRKTASKQAGKGTSALILVPTKELAAQVATVVAELAGSAAQDVRCANISRKEDVAVTRAILAETPDIVVSTPGRAIQFINSDVLKVNELRHLVIDEADLVLSYGHEEDLQILARSLPAGVQMIMMSATLRADIDVLSRLFFNSDDDANKPVVLDLSLQEAAEKTTLAQYTVRTAEDEKFLLIYAIFKLQLIRGKVIVFVADIDRCYRVKLFLEQFGIRSCVLNSELPVNSRLHVVNEFNRGVYDIIIAADEDEVVGIEDAKPNRKAEPPAEVEMAPRKNGDQQASELDEQEMEIDEDDNVGQQDNESEEPIEAQSVQTQKSKSRKAQKLGRKRDGEYGVSRGIDFRHVTCVLNFDMPSTSKSYTHRIGRTARAGQVGMAVSLVVPAALYRKHKSTSIPQCEHDEQVLAKIQKKQSAHGAELKEWGLDWTKLDGFRYRLADALRAVTRIAVREARTKELRTELITSEKLKRHFEENPDDLRHLRHDTESHAVRQQPHLKNVPSYLLPEGGKAAVSRDIGYVGLRKNSENRIRKARAFNKSRGKGRIAAKKGLDPLRSLNASGRRKK